MSFLTSRQAQSSPNTARRWSTWSRTRALEHGPGLGTFAFDDEGVPAQSSPIIRGGHVRGLHDLARNRRRRRPAPLQRRMRAAGWARLPLIRMTNVSLLPGEQSLEEVFADSDHGIYMETNRSWSIDDKRYNFQFGCEIGWEIRGGNACACSRIPPIAASPPNSGIAARPSPTAIIGRFGAFPTAAKASPNR